MSGVCRSGTSWCVQVETNLLRTNGLVLTDFYKQPTNTFLGGDTLEDCRRVFNSEEQRHSIDRNKHGRFFQISAGCSNVAATRHAVGLEETDTTIGCSNDGSTVAVDVCADECWTWCVHEETEDEQWAYILKIIIQNYCNAMPSPFLLKTTHLDSHCQCHCRGRHHRRQCLRRHHCVGWWLPIGSSWCCASSFSCVSSRKWDNETRK